MIERIQERIRLSSIIEQDTRLTKKGQEFVGRCPFHQEKTPSFYVNDLKGLYYCFGCGAKGNLFTYVMEKKRLSFQEALEILAQKAGIDLKKHENKPIQILYKIYEKACCFFEQHLNQIHGYLNQRKIPLEIAKSFRLGFCPASDFLYQSLKTDFKESALMESGLFLDSKQTRFKNRFIFPIRDKFGRVIAFGGRALQDKQFPKYINSIETPIFSKKKTLYGLYEANFKEHFILVEGYTDVIRLHQHGYKSAVAPLGTALSEEHLLELWHYDTKPFICFDGDKAGHLAEKRTVKLIIPHLSNKKSAQFIKLPENEDPDSCLQANSYLFKEMKQQASNFIEKIWELIEDRFNLSVPEEIVSTKNFINKIIKKIPDRTLSYEYSRFLSKMLWLKTRFIEPHKKSKVLSIQKKQKVLEQLLLAILINHPILLDEVHENLGRVEFQDSELDKIRKDILSSYHQSSDYKAVSMPIEKDWLLFIQSSRPLEQVREEWWEIWKRLFEKPDEQMGIDKWEQIKAMKSSYILGGDI